MRRRLFPGLMADCRIYVALKSDLLDNMVNIV